MITGARQGAMSGFRRLVAGAMARDLNVFVIPGPDIARAHGLDIEAAGLRCVASPRHASVLLVIGTLPVALREAAAVIYAQMMRPRALLALDAVDLSPLPAADVSTGVDQQDLIDGVDQLRRVFSDGAFRTDISDFDAPVLQIRIEYTCPMHPEVVQDEPGSCPKCGMFLVEREVQAGTGHVHTAPAAHEPVHEPHHMAHEAAPEYTCPMHPEVVQDKPGSCPKCGMNLEPRNTRAETVHEPHHMAHEAAPEYTCPMHPEVVQDKPGSCPKCGMNLEPRDTRAETVHEPHHMAHEAAPEYTCPMHPEVVQDKPGSCPKCGMNLEPRDARAEPAHEPHHSGHDETRAGMDHSAMNHDDMGFMSMIDVTKDLPRSGDGLPMEWIEAPFGPFFPGLPGGLLLTLTLDGDTVAESDILSLTGNRAILHQHPVTAEQFIASLSRLDPLAPVAYRVLACQALEHATGTELPVTSAHARVGALERERISSHLGWLALFGQQTGFDVLMRRAASLQLECRQASVDQLAGLKPSIQSLVKRLQHTLLLKSRTRGVGLLTADAELCGPVARAAGVQRDARATDRIYTALGFSPASRKEGDAFARLHLRLDEITHSLMLVEAAGAIALPETVPIGEISGRGESVLETPRGPARLQLTLENGRIATAQLETPSTRHLALVQPLLEQQELGDALVAVGSLDLSPWEVRQ